MKRSLWSTTFTSFLHETTTYTKNSLTAHTLSGLCFSFHSGVKNGGESFLLRVKTSSPHQQRLHDSWAFSFGQVSHSQQLLLLCLEPAPLQLEARTVHGAAHCHVGDERRGETICMSLTNCEMWWKNSGFKSLPALERDVPRHSDVLLVFQRNQVTFTLHSHKCE